MPPDSTFKVHCSLEAFEKADDPDGHTMRIGGLVTTDDLDKQGEILVQTGLDFGPFLTEGWFNDNHGQKAVDVLGYPTGAHFVQKGAKLPNGRNAPTNGWWAEGYLLNTESGRKTWQLCQALSKSPRQLGFSIEGKVQSRSPANDSIITRATVKNVAVTHCPVNTGTEMHALVKALTAGNSISNPGSAPGEGFPLRTESPGKKLTDAQTSQDDDDEPETQPVQKAESADGFRIVDELDIIDEWGPVLNRQLENLQPPARLSKAESRIIVSQRFPHLTSAEVDDIVSHAANS